MCIRDRSISKDCQDVDTAFRWLEYVLYNEAATVTRTIGIERCV